MPAKQLLAITRIEPERLDLALCNTSSAHPEPTTTIEKEERRETNSQTQIPRGS
jgi:hypothetical protein